MSLDYSLHAALFTSYGRSPSLPSLPHIGGQKALAFDTASDPITGPVEICITPDVRVRLDVKAVAADLSSTNSVLVLPALVPSWFHLGAGTWYLKATVA